MKTRTITLATGLLAVALTLVGCSPTGADSDSAPSDDTGTTAEFNDADVDFAAGMAVHHQQAIDMSDMLLEKDGVDERVAALAEDIRAAQGPEIETMNSWLDAWGADSDMGGMDHGDMGGMDDMGGMMSEDDMAALEQAPGPEASSLFLEQMIKHHQGA